MSDSTISRLLNGAAVGKLALVRQLVNDTFGEGTPEAAAILADHFEEYRRVYTVRRQSGGAAVSDATHAGNRADPANETVETLAAAASERRRWGRGQARNVVIAAGRHIDVEGLIPVDGRTANTRVIIRHVLQGASGAEIAEATGLNPSEVGRTCARVIPYIKQYIAEHGPIEGVTPDMLEPRPASENPVGYPLEEVKWRLIGQGVTLGALATEFGCSRVTVQRMLNGQVRGQNMLARALIDRAYSDPDEAAAKYGEYLADRQAMYDRRFGRE